MYLVYVIEFTIFLFLFLFLFFFYGSKSKPILTIKKTICFGACPIYEATLFDDRSVKFYGEKYVKFIGHKIFKLSCTDMNRIINEIKHTDVFDLKDVYDSNITDLPDTYLTIYDNDNVKKIRARHNIPIKLMSLINNIHEVVVDNI